MQIFHLSKNDIKSHINKKYGLLRQSLLMELYNVSKQSIIYDFNLVKIGCNILYQDINGKTIFHLAYEDSRFLEYLLFHINEIPSNIKTLCENSANHKAIELIEFHRLLNRCLSKEKTQIDEIIKDKKINSDIFFKSLNRKIAIFK